MIKENSNQPMSAFTAKSEAQKMAFAPVVFQVALTLRNTGILDALLNSKDSGLTHEEIVNKTSIPSYGTTVLLEGGMSSGIVKKNEDHYSITPLGYFILKDEMTRVNMDFIHDVCYQGLYSLEQSIREGKPSGLRVFGDWDTIYEGVTSLPEKARDSWYKFDHFYSDAAFPQVVPIVLKYNPSTLLDVGGNTGKWATQIVKKSENIKVTIMDLPSQLNIALSNAESAGLKERISGKSLNLLDHSEPFPKGFDAIWMSQFLDCFSEQDVVQLIGRAAAAMVPESHLFILEPLWDRQVHEAASFSLINISLYFTCMANGNSRMYSSDVMHRLIADAGLEIKEEVNNLGLCHTLLVCGK